MLMCQESSGSGGVPFTPDNDAVFQPRRSAEGPRQRRATGDRGGPWARTPNKFVACFTEAASGDREIAQSARTSSSSKVVFGGVVGGGVRGVTATQVPGAVQAASFTRGAAIAAALGRELRAGVEGAQLDTDPQPIRSLLSRAHDGRRSSSERVNRNGSDRL
ncbi:unnamed protein product [Lampetra planeri]